MQQDGFLRDFLGNYRPLGHQPDIESAILQHRRLKEYRLTSPMELLNARPGSVYIKFVRRRDMTQRIPISEMIRPGGFFIGGGTVVNHKFRAEPDPERWTHLCLKLDISKNITDGMPANISRRQPRYYCISIAGKNIYARHIIRFREYMERILEDIELVESKN